MMAGRIVQFEEPRIPQGRTCMTSEIASSARHRLCEGSDIEGLCHVIRSGVREFEHGCDNTEAAYAVLLSGCDANLCGSRLAGCFSGGSIFGAEKQELRSGVEKPALPAAQAISSFRPDVLICDIEGAEAEVIPAFDASNLRAAVIELHPDRISPAQIAAIHAALAGHGLSPVLPGPGGTVIIYNWG